jgi:hypothetical protein
MMNIQANRFVSIERQSAGCPAGLFGKGAVARLLLKNPRGFATYGSVRTTSPEWKTVGTTRPFNEV